jgi:8-oxo-dGTP pyrophosphatase MutT (NUDIX family)
MVIQNDFVGRYHHRQERKKRLEIPFSSTAIREAEEETGLTDLKFTWGTRYKETEPYRGGKKVARYYIAETTQSRVKFSINPELGMPEHHEYRWISLNETKDLAPARLIPIIEWANDVIDGS